MTRPLCERSSGRPAASDRSPIDADPRRPDLELVGVWVHSEDKVGKDAGELAGGEPMGVAATNDADALIALRPDCVVYAASGPERDAGAVPDYVRLLEAGINVVSTTSTSLVYPPAYYSAEWRDQTGGGGQVGKRVVLRLGDLPRVRVGSARASAGDAVQEDPHASRSPRSR